MHAFALYWSQTIRKRAAKVVALRKVWNQQRKQANKKLKVERVERLKLEHEFKMVFLLCVLLCALLTHALNIMCFCTRSRFEGVVGL